MFDIEDLGRNLSYQNFTDKRLLTRYDAVNKLLETGQSSIVNRITEKRSERKGCYDFFKNGNVKETHIKSSIYKKLATKKLKGANLVVIQDTCEYNYAHTNPRLKDNSGLGEISNKHGLGYFVHPSIVIDQSTDSIIGLSDIQLWNRESDRAPSSSRKQRKFEDKESYKWHVGLLNSHKRLEGANKVTYVQDRDGDVYESIVKVKSIDGAELLVRCCRDRNIELMDGTKKRLYAHLLEQEVLFNYELKIKGDKRKNRSKRVAQLEVRSVRVKLKCPNNLKKVAPSNLEVDVVWVREKDSSVPEGEKPIDWKLVTTHQVHGDQLKVEELIKMYVSRWKIEEFFFITKTGAYDLENALLETGYGLRKLGLMVMENAIKIMQLKQARDGESGIKVSAVFSSKEEEYLERILPTLEGETAKLKNPHTKKTLARAAWIIARLGGWKGYTSSRLPGTKTFKRGLDKFNAMALAWNIIDSR